MHHTKCIRQLNCGVLSLGNICMHKTNPRPKITLDLFASDPLKIMLSEGGFLWKL